MDRDRLHLVESHAQLLAYHQLDLILLDHRVVSVLEVLGDLLGGIDVDIVVVHLLDSALDEFGLLFLLVSLRRQLLEELLVILCLGTENANIMVGDAVLGGNACLMLVKHQDLVHNLDLVKDAELLLVSILLAKPTTWLILEIVALITALMSVSIAASVADLSDGFLSLCRVLHVMFSSVLHL